MEMNKAEVSAHIATALKDAGLDELLERLKDIAANPVTPPEKPAEPEEKAMKETEKLGRVLRALAVGKGDCGKAAHFARKNWRHGEEVAKALEAGDEAAGGFLIRDEMSNALIELLYPASVVRAAGARVVPLSSGTLTMPKVTAGVSGQWIGEGENIPLTEPSFGQIQMTAKKYAALTPLSNDLLRRDSIQADQFVRDDFVRDIALAEDVAFIRGDGTAGQPKGMRYWALAAGVNDDGGDTLDLATKSLVGMIKRMGENNIPMSTPHWFMDWGSWAFLTTLRDGNGNQAYKAEMDNKTLFSMPYSITSQIPRNLGGSSDSSELYLADMSEMIIGDTMNVTIDASDTAAYHDGSNVIASFSKDQTVIRAIVEVDFMARRPEAIEVLTDLDGWTV
jgi:HK97 family phage major capsid protein